MKLKGVASERIEYAGNLLENARGAIGARAEQFRRDWAQYRGDRGIDSKKNIKPDEESRDNSVISNRTRKGVGNPDDAETIYNISYEMIEGQIDTGIPSPKVTPIHVNRHTEDTAQMIEQLLLMLRDKHNAEEQLDAQERVTRVLGCAPTLITWDNTITTHDTVGEATETEILPTKLYPQPGIHDIQDADYVICEHEITRSYAQRLYGVGDEDIEGKAELYVSGDGLDSDDITADSSSSSGAVAGSGEDGVDDVLCVYTMWYRDDDGNICKYVWSGQCELEWLEDYYARRIEVCECCGKRRELCEKEPCGSPRYAAQTAEYEELDHDIILPETVEETDPVTGEVTQVNRVIPAMSPLFRDGKPVMVEEEEPETDPATGEVIMDITLPVPVPRMKKIMRQKYAPTRLPYYKPKKFPIDIRYNTRLPDSIWGISDMEIIRDQQQMINKCMSRLVRKIMASGCAGILPDTAREDLTNGIFDVTYFLRPGESAAQYGQVEYKADISQEIAAINLAREQCKALLGITDSYTGQGDTTAKSGYAKQLQIQQSAGRLLPKSRMKNISFANRDEIIAEFYAAYADEERNIPYRDSDGRWQNRTFSRYSLYQMDETTGEWYIDMGYTFSIDQSSEVGTNRVQMWEIIKGDYASGMYGDIANPESQLDCWIDLEENHYPGAHNRVEKLRKKISDMQAQMNAVGAVPGGAVNMNNMGGGNV